MALVAPIIADVEILFLRPGAVTVETNPASLNIQQSEWVPTEPRPHNQNSGRRGKTTRPITVTYKDAQQVAVGLPQILPIGTAAKLFTLPGGSYTVSFQFGFGGVAVANPEQPVQFGGVRRKTMNRRTKRKHRTMKMRKHRK